MWTVTKTKEDLTDSFHRRLLRAASQNIRYSMELGNNKVYEMTKKSNYKNGETTMVRTFMRQPINTPAKSCF